MANELTVVNDADKELITTVLGGNLAQDIEFTQLDSAIEKIAAHTKALTPEERVDASIKMRPGIFSLQSGEEWPQR